MKYKWDLIGHFKQRTYLQKQIESGKISHAYVFVGLKNLGKFKLAKQFANIILCNGKDEKKPCGKCINCRQFKKNIHPHFHIIEPLKNRKTQNIGIEQVRSIIKELSRKSFGNSWQIVIIRQAHNINIQAANAILKTLEEPGKKQIIILLAENFNSLPLTIISRCQIIKFLPVAKKDIFVALKKDIYDESQLETLCRLANGLPLVMQDFFTKKNKLVDYEELIQWTLSLLEKNNCTAKLKMFEIKYKKIEATQAVNLINTWISLWRDLLLQKNNQADLIINYFANQKIQAVSEKYSNSKINNMISLLEKTRSQSVNKNYKLWFENLIINNL
ncbi:MAG: DNA polymerase III subunit delta' [Patescibacteria group bacterium]